LVSIWKVLCGAAAIVCSTVRVCASGTQWPIKSLIESMNTSCGGPAAVISFSTPSRQ
jgi:hypothetical protein